MGTTAAAVLGLLTLGCVLTPSGRCDDPGVSNEFVALWDTRDKARILTPDEVQSEIARGANVDAMDQWHDTALLAAVDNGNPQVVLALLNAGANVEAVDKDGDTPLINAAHEGDLTSVQLLLNKHSNYQAADRWGMTALMWALTSQIAEALVDQGASLEQKDKLGQTALVWAASADRVDVVSFLLSRNADVNCRDQSGMTPLLHCLTWGNKRAIIPLLLDKGADPNAADSTGATPLSLATTTREVRLLLQSGARVDTRGQYRETPLMSAPNADVARLLLLRGVDANAVDAFGQTPLMWASFYGRLDVVNALLAAGANVETRSDTGETALMRASDPDVALSLIAKGARINEHDNDGNTPLMWAVFPGSADTVRLLISKGANVNARNRFGQTPLMRAANPDIARILIQDGADVNARDSRGMTPLLWMAVANYPDTGRAALDGLDHSNAKPLLGESPLRGIPGASPPSGPSAPLSGKGAVVQVLMANGVDLAARDATGKSAADWASDNPDVLAVLPGKYVIHTPSELR